jgi:hypothetical protein
MQGNEIQGHEGMPYGADPSDQWAWGWMTGLARRKLLLVAAFGSGYHGGNA